MGSTLRPIMPMQFAHLPVGEIDAPRPRYVEAAPTSLLVDERYQRNLSHRSVALIRRIVAQWDWRAFKPPVVVETDGGLHVIDGQHTAIAAASHPALETIPVQIVEAETQELRAGAFVRHNRDRIAVTPQQLHHALVAAGDEDSQTIEQVCARAGARVLKFSPADGRYNVGDIVGVSTLRKLVERRFAAGARRVVEVCVQAKLAPISSSALRAVEFLLFEREYAGQLAGEDIATTLRSMGTEEAERQAKLFAAEHRVRAWRALAIVLYRNTRKRRGSAAAA